MAISIPDATQLRITTGVQDVDDYLPGVAGTGGVIPGPVVVSGAANSAGQPAVLNAQEGVSNKGGENYYGFNLSTKAVGQPCSIVRKCTIEGLAGMTIGAAVYVDSAAAAGLTHTKTTGIGRIGVAATATRLRLD